jgi:hypothetical protein
VIEWLISDTPANEKLKVFLQAQAIASVTQLNVFNMPQLRANGLLRVATDELTKGSSAESVGEKGA